ncbi:hypothetical protein F4779DRAFT_630117 [Xylariaceae sp. FL0662B]|nr:hypothetical protein F4779DRAFT_630117 [Xylariaceae sp. FL0662B]
MAYQHFPYSDATQFSIYMDSPTIDTSMDGVIDPILEQSVSPTQFANPWNPPQMQRHLTDNDKSTFFEYPVLAPGLAGFVNRGPDGVPPLPSGLLQRRDSPSYSHSSPASSSVLSPPMESDYYQAHSPSTSTDTESPFSSQYENYSSHGQLCQFTGLADDCVKPVDVNPFQETPQSYYEDNISKPAFPTRGFSMSSDDSATHTDLCSRLAPFELDRPLSPESIAPEAKKDVHISRTNGACPSFEPGDETMSGEEVAPAKVKIEQDDDEEYSPNKKHKRKFSNASRSTRSRKRSSTSQPTIGAKRPKTGPNESAMSKSTTKPAMHGTKGSFACTECPKPVVFKDESGLHNHIKKQHTRPFICVFEFAGCNSTFASKNEWKRHCSSQHLILNYWVCQEDQCAKAPNSSSKSAASRHNSSDCARRQVTCATHIHEGTIFNRKDLYTQHLRRMHIPAHLKRQVKQKKTVPEWDALERAHQEKAKRSRCTLPTHMRCPATGCNTHFDGQSAWDDRMEHVAKHLEKAVAGAEPQIKCGAEHDKTLIDWATRADIAIIERGQGGNWELRNPLKSDGGLRIESLVDEDEDAEGEEVDE